MTNNITKDDVADAASSFYLSRIINLGSPSNVSKACGSREPQKRSRYNAKNRLPSTRIKKVNYLNKSKGGFNVSSAKSKVDEIVVNTTAIARMFNLTERRVRQLVEEGVIPRVGHGRFNLIETVSKYITFLKVSSEGLDSNDVAESYEYEKWLHEKAKREKAEIDLAHLRNEMHRSEDVEKVLNHMVMAFRSKILSLPTKAASILINKSDPKLIEALLERDVHEALKELAEYDPAMFVELGEEDVVEIEGGEIEEDGQKTHIKDV